MNDIMNNIVNDERSHNIVDELKASWVIRLEP